MTLAPNLIFRRAIMGRSVLIGLAAFSTTILLIVTHTGVALV
ncbi:hypothetical protein [Sphingomonas faeni]|nr:hypothetical protein [Sphingomonas faeni]